ncbi:MAG: tryptophan synthase subunit alpha [Idiomarina sp.]|nr:tryptophan synthase subunit alpha [Idiomarina sp.]
MSRYTTCFQALRDRKEGAFVPFVTLGDPTIAQSELIIDALIAGGADALELGLPFSDPVADGPVIQAANIRALNSGTKIAHCFELLGRVRAKHPTVPIGLLVYCNLIHAQGVNAFYQRCAEVGVDSVLVADVPLRESATYRQAADNAGIEAVFICPPDAGPNTLKQVAEFSQGYVYLLSRAGVTGADQEVHLPAEALIQGLAEHHSAPPLLGFGIAKPEHVRSAIQSGAMGAISGSAIVRIIAEFQQDMDRLVSELTQFVRSMKEATKA